MTLAAFVLGPCLCSVLPQPCALLCPMPVQCLPLDTITCGPNTSAVYQAGGSISAGRVNCAIGSLAMTRAFGDFSYKQVLFAEGAHRGGKNGRMGRKSIGIPGFWCTAMNFDGRMPAWALQMPWF